ncbi:hypothetical protein IFR05_003075 [Cadophora sp. M221]|nr:hypothetical protein IFR05_003075 [Cadophora sp. M221]
MASQQIRAEATAAAESYGWGHQRKGDWKYIDASLMKQNINTPSCDPKDTKTGPSSPQRQVPRYEEPAIDWQRWDGARQGPHGRLPPMPEEPVPIRPLRTMKGRLVRDLGRGPTMAPTRSQEIVSPLLSPLSSSISSQRSPVSPTSVVEDMMSNLEEHIVDSLGDWQKIRQQPQARCLADHAAVKRSGDEAEIECSCCK